MVCYRRGGCMVCYRGGPALAQAGQPWVVWAKCGFKSDLVPHKA